MEAQRENFNLLSKTGRYYFFKRGWFGDKWSRKFVLQDTFQIKIRSGINEN